MVKRTKVKIGPLTIAPPLFLAPMAGLTHSALRQLILDFGGVGLLSTEMLSAARLPSENPAISPYLITTEREHPLSYQLLIYSSKHVVGAVAKIKKLGADIIDINLGCGAPKVIKKGGGRALLKRKDELEKIIKEIKEKTELPITAKIRLGERFDINALSKECDFLQSVGLDAIYLHCRLEKEPFCRPPRWNKLPDIKELLDIDIPIIINGGIFGLKEAKEALEITKADGLMIGRGAAIKPWIFKTISDALFSKQATSKGVSDIYLPDVFFRFYGYLEKLFPPERQIGRLKEFTHYFSQNYAFGNRLAMSVQRCKDMNEAKTVAMEFFRKNEKILQVSPA